jgi:L-lactate dehydrogenase complex protein LldG
MSARDEIFANIRRSLHVSGADAPRRAAVADRLARSPAGVIPERGRSGLAAFKEEAARAAATLSEVASAAEIPAEIARFLREHNLPATLRIGADPRLAGLPWAETALEMSHGASDGHDLNAASVAFAGVAETGTLALVSGGDNPTTLNFLADNHVVVVFAEDVLGDMEGVFARLRATYGAGQAPRTLNFITGPSRSADIEQTLLFGAHGPRRLHIVLVNSGGLAEPGRGDAEGLNQQHGV